MTDINQTRKDARVAGVLYLLIGLTAPIGLGELPIIFWLLIWGAKSQPVRVPASS